jgi:hypothetical protein
MGHKRSFDDTASQLQPACMNLRSKAIYVTGNPDPRPDDDVGSTRFNCWCNTTQHVLGPDQALVDRTACVNGRECYLPRA